MGPVYGQDKNEAQLLRNCYHNALQLAVSHSLSSIALPAISTGAYAYPPAEAATVASAAVAEFLSLDRTLREVRLVFIRQRDADIFLDNQQFDR